MKSDINPDQQRFSSSVIKALRSTAIIMALLAYPLAAGAGQSFPEPSAACQKLMDKSVEAGDQAWEQCRKEAEQGQVMAQLWMGMAYWQRFEDFGKGRQSYPQNGEDVPKEKEAVAAEAVKWIKKAARQGLPEAQVMLAVTYSQSKMVVVDEEMALMWLKKAAEHKDTHEDVRQEVAMTQSSRPALEAVDSAELKTCRRLTIDEDTTETRQACQQAAEQGDIAAQYYVGMMYRYGYGVEKNYETARKWFIKAAEQGNPVAQYYAAYIEIEILNSKSYSDEEAMPRIKDVVKWLDKSAAQGDAYAQFGLGALYRDGEGVPKDEAKAVELIRLAAEQGLANAQYTLGNMYASGEGVKEDKAEAAKWYKKAADQGHAYAKRYYDELRRDDDTIRDDE
ncbi:MAG: SEL1-like repeat protein [Methylobacillus sp.]|jgi:TPR repeat protein|nr:SEL1-like repeat protein [Methylobacillus sp.]